MKLVAYLRSVRVSRCTKTIPEELVVEVAATIKLDGLGQVDDLVKIVASLSFHCLLNELVQVIDVATVVFTVVEVH